MDKTVTINFSQENHVQPFGVKEGDKIKLGINSWFIAPQRIKNKMMVHRLLKKEYYPYFIVKKVDEHSEATTLSLKPYNF